MPQPPQLARAYKPRKSTRPILEQLPAVNTTELHISSIYRGKPAKIKPLRIPRIESVKVSLTRVDFHFQSLHRGQRGRTETFRLKPIRTGFGTFRYCFHCNTCGRPVVRLYYFNHTLMCRCCCNGRHATQAISRQSRPALQISRITDFLSSKSRLLRRTRERLTKRLGEKIMRAQGQLGTDARPVWE
jgi:hypothetical protein